MKAETKYTSGAARAAKRWVKLWTGGKENIGFESNLAKIIDEETHTEELLHSLRFLTDAAESEPAMAIYRAHIAKARAIIAMVTV